jgi:hypothetical protein
VRHSVGMCCVVRPARISRSPTTPAVTAIARSARAVRRIAGSKRARPTCCRSSITTWYSRCPHRSEHWPTATSQWSTPYPKHSLQPKHSLRLGWAPLMGQAFLFKAVAETLRTIAADPKHLGARVGLTLVLHTWGSAMIHHPHVHGIVPGGGLSLDGKRWIHCRPGFFLPIQVLSCLFRRLFLERLSHAYQAGELKFFGECQSLAETKAFLNWIKPLRKINWVAYAKPPFAGPEQVLAYLSRYTHRVAISNSRLLSFDQQGVTFKWKDYRAKPPFRNKIMTLKTDEFIRRFLIHVLPSGFHRIRHYGLLANSGRRDNLKRARELLIAKTDDEDANEKGVIENTKSQQDDAPELAQATYLCPDCGSPMVIIERFERGQLPHAPPVRIIAA